MCGPLSSSVQVSSSLLPSPRQGSAAPATQPAPKRESMFAAGDGRADSDLQVKLQEFFGNQSQQVIRDLAHFKKECTDNAAAREQLEPVLVFLDALVFEGEEGHLSVRLREDVGQNVAKSYKEILSYLKYDLFIGGIFEVTQKIEAENFMRKGRNLSLAALALIGIAIAVLLGGSFTLPLGVTVTAAFLGFTTIGSHFWYLARQRDSLTLAQNTLGEQLKAQNEDLLESMALYVPGDKGAASRELFFKGVFGELLGQADLKDLTAAGYISKFKRYNFGRLLLALSLPEQFSAALKRKDTVTCQHLLNKKGDRSFSFSLPTLVRDHAHALWFEAVKQGDTEVCQILRKAGLKTTITDNIGRTALHHAVQSSQWTVCAWLFDTEGFISFREKDLLGNVPASYADTEAQMVCLKRIVAGGRGTALHYAFWAEDNATCLALLNLGGIDVNATDSLGNTALHYAAKENAGDLVQALITAGADVNAKDSLGKTALYYAAKENAVNIVQALIIAGADVNAKDGQHNTVLYDMVQLDRPAICQLLLTKGADVNATSGNQGRTPLHCAVRCGNPLILQTLLAAGADVNATDDEGNSALHYAVEKGDLRGIIAPLLAVNGINANLQNKNGWPPLHYAAIKWDGAYLLPDLLKAGADMMLPYTPKNSSESPKNSPKPLPCPWFVALESHNPSTCQAFLQAGAPVNVQDGRGRTPLHWAINHQNQELCQLLLEKGADVNAKDSEGYMALHLAIRSLNYQIFCPMLLEKGADVNAVSGNGYTPLSLVVMFWGKNTKDISFCKQFCADLIKRGANVHAIDKEGYCILQTAFFVRNKDLFLFFLNAGACMKGFLERVEQNEGRISRYLKAFVAPFFQPQVRFNILAQTLHLPDDVANHIMSFLV